MGVNWTSEQRKVIELRDRNILVSAAAGSGKTAVLVERIIQRITDEEKPVDIDRLLVMTFTRAAAGEMRVRLEQALSKRLEEDPENEYLQRQSTLLHNAQITTIDGFCSYLIRNYFHMIDLDPGYRTADEGELKLLRVDVVRGVLEECYAQKSPDFEEFAECFAPGKSDEGLEELVLKLYDFAMSAPWPEEWLSQCVSIYEAEDWESVCDSVWMKEVWKHTDKILSDLRNLIQENMSLTQKSDGPYMYEPMVEDDLALVERLCRITDYDEMGEALEGLSYARLSTKKDLAVSQLLKERVQENRKQMKERLGKLQEQYFYTTSEGILSDFRRCRGPMQVLITVTLRFLEKFSQKKREKNLVDFADMEHFALNILVKKEGERCTPTQAAWELSQRYEEILIDEYQDSNYVQEMLLTYVSGWAKQKKNIFMVGDVKQSIYRFRLAVPDLFMEKYHRYTLEDSQEQRIDLHKNFRSRAQVLDGINFLFRQIMGQELGKVEYDQEAALYPGAVFPEENSLESSDTELLLIPQETMELMEDKEATTQREVEALAIAQRIHQMVGKERVLDKDSGTYRPVRYGDIVVLLRTVSGWAEDFLRVFAGQGIPAYTASKTGYFSALEVVTVLNYLHICDNPLQEIPFTAVLHSPIVGCTAQELAILKTSAPKLPVYARCLHYVQEGEDVCLRRKLESFLKIFQEHRKKVPYTPIHQLIQEILEETGYGRYAGALPGGRQRQANLNMLVEKAMDFEQTSYRGLFNFIRYIEKIQKYNVDFGEVNLSGSSEDTVQILSIHKSKGLEFPIVFVAGMGKKFNQQDLNAVVVVHPDLGLGVDVVDPKLRVRCPTLPKQLIRAQLKDENLGEELRVFYVALTRAKEKLILTGTVSKLEKRIRDCAALLERERERLPYSLLAGAQCGWDWILPALARHPAMEELYDRFEVFHGRALFEQEPAKFHIQVAEAGTLVVGELEEKLQRQLLRERMEQENWEEPEDEETYRVLEERFSYLYPYEILEQIPVKVTVSELKRRQQAEEDSDFLYFEPDVIPLVPDFIEKKEEEYQGASRGTVYHRVMERLDYTRAGSEEQIQEQLEEMCLSGRMSRQERDCVKVEDIWKLLCSELGKRMALAAAQGRLYREQPFVISQPASQISREWPDRENILVQGMIDAWFLEEDHLVLVDYKTDRVYPGQERLLREKYRVQLENYAQALKRLTGKKVAEKVIYSFSMSKEIRV